MRSHWLKSTTFVPGFSNISSSKVTTSAFTPSSRFDADRRHRKTCMSASRYCTRAERRQQLRQQQHDARASRVFHGAGRCCSVMGTKKPCRAAAAIAQERCFSAAVVTPVRAFVPAGRDGDSRRPCRLRREPDAGRASGTSAPGETDPRIARSTLISSFSMACRRARRRKGWRFS